MDTGNYKKVTEQELNPFSILTCVFSVLAIEHITAQDLELTVKIICQLSIAVVTVYTMLKNSKEKKGE